MKFIEAKLEKAFTDLLGQEGIPHHLGITIARKPDDVLIEEDLQKFLLPHYKAEGLTVTEAKSIMSCFDESCGEKKHAHFGKKDR